MLASCMSTVCVPEGGGATTKITELAPLLRTTHGPEKNKRTRPREKVGGVSTNKRDNPQIDGIAYNKHARLAKPSRCKVIPSTMLLPCPLPWCRKTTAVALRKSKKTPRAASWGTPQPPCRLLNDGTSAARTPTLKQNPREQDMQLAKLRCGGSIPNKQGLRTANSYGILVKCWSMRGYPWEKKHGHKPVRFGRPALSPRLPPPAIGHAGHASTSPPGQTT